MDSVLTVLRLGFEADSQKDDRNDWRWLFLVYLNSPLKIKGLKIKTPSNDTRF